MPLNIVKEVDQFSPHIAACSMSINDGAANKRDIDVIRKSKIKSDKEVALLKILGEDSPETIEKASVRNTESMLRAAIKERFENDEEYRWIWLEDFDPEEGKAVFEMDGKSWVIGYSLAESGLVELEEDYKEVISHKVYTTADENNLILKSKDKDSEISSEVKEDEEDTLSTSEVNLKEEKEEEDNMSDKKDAPVEFSKAQLNQIEELLKAKEAETLARIEAENLLKSTTETLGGLEMVAEGDVEVLAKGIVANKDLGEVFLKSLSSAQELIKAAKDEAEEIKKELGSHEQITSEEEVKELEKGVDTNSTLKAQLAKLSK